MDEVGGTLMGQVSGVVGCDGMGRWCASSKLANSHTTAVIKQIPLTHTQPLLLLWDGTSSVTERVPFTVRLPMQAMVLTRITADDTHVILATAVLVQSPHAQHDLG